MRSTLIPALGSLVLSTCLPIAAHGQSALSPAFAKEAFRVVKQIESEAGRPSMDASGSILVPRETASMIDDLDADAKEPEAQATVKMLHQVWRSKLRNNLHLNTLALKVEAAMYDAKNVFRGPADVADAVQKTDIAASIHSKEAACFEALENSLRQQQYAPQAACAEDTLEVEIPEGWKPDPSTFRTQPVVVNWP